MGYRVLCVSGLDAAGAGAVAHAVAARLAFRVIDEDIITRAALTGGLDAGTVASVEHRKSTLSTLVESLALAGTSGRYQAVPPPIDALYGPQRDETLRELIRAAIVEAAADGDAVLASHAASFALAGRDDTLRVLVTSSLAIHRRRLAAELGVGAREAARLLKQSDAGRADYLRKFYGVPAEHPTHYDLVINTDRVTTEQAARLISATVDEAS